MDKYTLSNEGRARFRRMRLDLETPTSGIDRYEILSYLYENGSGTVAEIINYTGLSWEHVMNKLSTLMFHGYIEALTKQGSFV